MLGARKESVNTHWSFVARVYPAVMAYGDGKIFLQKFKLKYASENAVL